VSTATNVIAVTGATGFIGKHLLNSLMRHSGHNIRALTRRIPEDAPKTEQLQWVVGVLDNRDALETLLVPGCVLVHLAYPGKWDGKSHLNAARQLAETSARRGVSRVVHCSTATVVGRVADNHIFERTVANPRTGYEINKLAIENLWLDYAKKFDLVIARPTAVIGPGGKNLLKLANDLLYGNRWLNYLRSCLYADRQMNLVAVENVVAALELMIGRDIPFDGKIFNISDDDDPINRFCDIELLLMRALGLRYYDMPPIKLPPFVLREILRASGVSNINPGRRFDSSELHKIGWSRVCRLEEGVARFAASLSAGSRGA
jgi:nucleoside-diphosphate-sugar epimerase